VKYLSGIILREKVRPILLVIIIILSCYPIIFDFNSDFSSAEAKTITVNDDGGANYKKIQTAINNANAGDTIRVWAGTYNENLKVNKTVTLIGNRTTKTTIDGGGSGNVIWITGDWVNITGFTITNSGSIMQNAGIFLSNVKNCKIYNNNVSSNNENGVWLSHGINNIIENNTCSYNNYDGIAVGGGSNNSLINNTCNYNKYFGIRLIGSLNNSLINNTCCYNKHGGFQIHSSSSTNIVSNTISFGRYGIFLSSSTSNRLMNNTMVSCGLFFGTSSLNEYIKHTIIKNNTVNGKPVCYWKNIIGGTVPLNMGQVILANCRDVIVENQNFNDVSCGIELGFSNNITIRNITSISNKMYGIFLCQSSKNLLINNKCNSNNWDGIQIRDYSNKNVFINNTCNSNKRHGFYFHTKSYLNNLMNNTFCSNKATGVFIDFRSKSNILIKNTCSYNYIGVQCDRQSDTNLIINCSINYNYHGIVFQDSSSATIHYNSIYNNAKFGVKNKDSSILINATYNWWGNCTGPYDPSDDRINGGWYNPNGTGDNVSDYVMYKPWQDSGELCMRGIINTPTQVTIDIDPDTLNLKSKGRWITCYIGLPEGYDVNDIDISTIIQEDTIHAEWGDVHDDTLMVKFDRSEVEDMLSPGTYNLKVTGKLTDGTMFEGYSDEIRVINPSKK
jgi:parallel beta-helix repeat protein